MFLFSNCSWKIWYTPRLAIRNVNRELATTQVIHHIVTYVRQEKITSTTLSK